MSQFCSQLISDQSDARTWQRHVEREGAFLFCVIYFQTLALFCSLVSSLKSYLKRLRVQVGSCDTETESYEYLKFKISSEFERGVVLHTSFMLL